ncbi:hypothetical protein [Alteromonas sp. P256]|uniref:hypothetical protein n=1 Tax=Alteromonas sp. P256 TaxID=3117399 RepID=UPI002FE2DFF4
MNLGFNDKKQISWFKPLVVIGVGLVFTPLYFAAWYLILFSDEPFGKFKDYFSLFTSTVSAFGGIGAAFAAYFSFRVAKQSNQISLKNTELLYSSHLDVEYKLNKIVDPEPSIRLTCCGPGPCFIKRLFIIHNSKKYEWSKLETVFDLSNQTVFAEDGLGFNIFNSPVNVLAPNHSIDIVLYSWPEKKSFLCEERHSEIENFFGSLEVEIEYEDVLGNRKSYIKHPPFKLDY